MKTKLAGVALALVGAYAVGGGAQRAEAFTSNYFSFDIVTANGSRATISYRNGDVVVNGIYGTVEAQGSGDGTITADYISDTTSSFYGKTLISYDISRFPDTPANIDPNRIYLTSRYGIGGSFYVNGLVIPNALYSFGGNDIVGISNGMFAENIGNGRVEFDNLSNTDSPIVSAIFTLSPVPLPASAPLFGGALLLLLGAGYGWKATRVCRPAKPLASLR